MRIQKKRAGSRSLVLPTLRVHFKNWCWESASQVLSGSCVRDASGAGCESEGFSLAFREDVVTRFISSDKRCLRKPFRLCCPSPYNEKEETSEWFLLNLVRGPSAVCLSGA